MSINAGQDLSVKGSNVLADQNVNLQAGGNVKIEAAQNTQSSSNFSQTTKSGLMSSGGIGFTVGSRMQSVDQGHTQTTAAGSTVGSTGGNVTINAGKTYTQTGSDVLTPAGDIAITAKAVDINEARETGSQSTEQKFKQSGLTVAITSPVLSAVQTANNQLQAAGNTSSGRMQALAAANAAINLKQGADAIKAGQGDANGMVKTGARNDDGSLKTNADGSPETAPANAADKAGGIGISISIGASSSQSKQQSSADTAKGSNLNAGGNVSITATGSGKDSDITVRGSNIEAGKATRLKADDQVNIVAAQNTTQESSNSSSKSGSVGVAIQFGAGGGGMGFTASASASKGQGAGNSTTYTNSQVAGNTVNIESGGDTTIKGGVVKADQVTANVGGNLNIESLQDKSQYNEKSQSAGGSVMVGAGFSGSVNVAASKVNSDYLSVGEQSAIRAGDGGFNVNVQGKTTLTGGQISSTQAAIDNNKNSYEAKEGTTTIDLQNSAKYSAQSMSVGIGAGALPGQSASAGMSGVGLGSDKGSANSTTTAGISGITGNTSARTGDKSTSIAPIFDKDKTQKEVAAQVAITSEFGKQASKLGGTVADKQRDDLKAQAKQAQDSGNPEKAQALLAEAAKWDEGGAYRASMHAVIGGLTGGAAGAVGAGAASSAAPTLNELQGQLEAGLQKAGLGDSASKVIAGLASGTTAAAIGAAASGGSVAGGATAFNADMNNRQLHPTEAKLIKDNAKAYAQQRFGTANPSAAQLSQAEAELTQQALKQVDSAYASAPNNDQAASYLNTLTRGGQTFYQQTGQTLFNETSNAALFNNHALNAQYLADPGMRALYNQAQRPTAGSKQFDGAGYALMYAAGDTQNLNKLSTDERKQVLQALVQASSEYKAAGTSTASTVQAATDRLAADMQRSGEITLGERVQISKDAFMAMGAGQGAAGMTIAAGARGTVAAEAAAQQAQSVKINALADEAKAANSALNKANSTPADSTYVAPAHTSTEKFQTHGLTVDQVPASIRNQLTQDLQATFGAGAKSKADEIINSGSSVPVPMQATAETKLYKLVPDSSAYGPKSDSPYFVDAAQLQRIQQNPNLANDILGLPSGSQSTGFKVYEVQPMPSAKPTVYQSDVATATNKAGPTAVGNGTQTLVPDRSLWTEPKLTNIKIGGK